LSTVRAVLTSGSGDSQGGKRRGRVEQFRDPFLHHRLIVLHVQNVVRPFFCQGFRNLRLTEHRITGNDLPLQRQHAEESQCGLVFVRLRIDTQLPDDGLNLRREHSDQVDRGDFAIVTASKRFAIEGEVFAEIRTALKNPVPQYGFEGVDIDASEDARVGGDTGCFAASESESVGEFVPVIASELGDALE
jgi:hypothetical protein